MSSTASVAETLVAESLAAQSQSTFESKDGKESKESVDTPSAELMIYIGPLKDYYPELVSKIAKYKTIEKLPAELSAEMVQTYSKVLAKEDQIKQTLSSGLSPFQIASISSS